MLAATLERLAREGVEDFYQGDIARIIHEDMIANNGFIRDDDLAQIDSALAAITITGTRYPEKQMKRIGL